MKYMIESDIHGSKLLLSKTNGCLQIRKTRSIDFYWGIFYIMALEMICLRIMHLKSD